MEAIKQTTKSNKAMAASQAVGKHAMPGLFHTAQNDFTKPSPSFLQTKLRVNKPGDQYEREADATADKVMRMKAGENTMIVNDGKSVTDKNSISAFSKNSPATISRLSIPGNCSSNVFGSAVLVSRKCKHCSEEEKTLQKKAFGETEDRISKSGNNKLRFIETELKSTKGGGQPLPPSTNAFMNRAMGADFSNVRIHTDAKAVAMNHALHAHAFTHGKDIYFNTAMYNPDSASGKRLLAHELTHVVQQGHPLQVQKTSKKEEKEPPAIQRFGVADLEALNPLDISIDDLVKKYMPELFDIKNAGGIMPWLEKKVTSAADTMLNAAAGPVKGAVGFISNLSPVMAKIINWIKTAGVKISKNDCSSFIELGQMIEQLADELAAPAIEKIKELAKSASAWFSDVWEKFGLPVWDFIKKYAGNQWEMIKSLGNKIWEKTQPVRDWAESVWIRFKNWLGIGEGPEGQNGIIQWIEGKLTAVWDKIKEKAEPFKKQLMIAGGVLVMLSPAGPLIAAGALFAGVITAVNWVRKNMQSPQDIARLRVKFQKEILPSIIQGLTNASNSLRKILGSVTDKLNSVIGALGKLVALAADGILSFIQSALQWITDKFAEIADWAGAKLTDLSNWLQKVFDSVRGFATLIIHFFEKVSAVVDNIMSLPGLILGGLWKMVPKCIRDGIEDFLINVILKNVPFFEDVATVVKYWQKIKQGVIDVIKTVFINGDLKGGILKAFKLFLDVLGIPVQLVVSIYNKAVSAFDQIVNKPKVIFGNIVSAIKSGFSKFSGNFLKNSIDALGNWIFSKVKGVKMPKDFTVKSIFGLVMDILGITEDNIFKRIEKKTSKPFADKLRKVYEGVKTAARWIIQIIKDPKAAYEQAKEKLTGLKDKLFKSIGSWISKNVIGKFVAQITAELASTPFGEAVEAIIDAYKMIQTAIEYAERILRVVDSVLDSILDLAAGVISKAADTVEKGLTFGLEIAVAFIAKVVSIGNLPEQVKKIVEEDIRPVIDSAIDSVVDKVIGIVKSIKEFLGLGDKKDKSGTDQDEIYKEEFLIGSEQHKLTAAIKNGQFIMTMASNEDLDIESRIRRAITSIENDINRDKQEKTKILKILNPALVKVGFLRSDYQTYISTINRISFDKFVKPKITAIINSLRPLEKYKVEGIHDIISVPKRRKIPGTFGIRDNLYDKTARHAWDKLSETLRKPVIASISKDCFDIKTLYDDKSNPNNEFNALTKWKEQKDKERIPSWAPPLTFYNHLKDFDKFKYETDHKKPLGWFWNNGENDKDDKQRSKTLLDTSNLQVLTDEANGKKGGVTFDRIVGSDFESAAAYSPKGFNTIAGIPFEEG